MAKTKIKTKSSVKGRFKISAGGKVSCTTAGHRHNLGKRSKRFLRSKKGYGALAAVEVKKVKRYMMPNG